VKKVLFTRVSDNLYRVSVAYHYARQHGCAVDLCLDGASGCLTRLLEAQLWTRKVFVSAGIEDCFLGGQPFDFGRDALWREEYDEVFHLGYQRAPMGNLTLEAWQQSGVPIRPEHLLLEPSRSGPLRRLTSRCIHIEVSEQLRCEQARATLLPIFDQLQEHFDTISVLDPAHDPDYYESLLKAAPGKLVLTDSAEGLHQVANLVCESVLLNTRSCFQALAASLRVPQVVLLADRPYQSSQRSYRSEVLVPTGDPQRVLEEVLILRHVGMSEGSRVSPGGARAPERRHPAQETVTRPPAMPLVTDELAVLVIATHIDRSVSWFLESCHRTRMPLMVRGQGAAWRGFGWRLKATVATLQEIGDRHKYVLLADPHDSILVHDGATLLAKSLSLDHPLVFSAEKTCYPGESRTCAYPEAGTPYRFLDASVWTGEVRYVCRVLCEGRIFELPNHVLDHQFFTELFLANPAVRRLDSRCEVFQTLCLSEGDLEKADGIHNRVTGTYLSLICANGMANLAPHLRSSGLLPHSITPLS